LSEVLIFALLGYPALRTMLVGNQSVVSHTVHPFLAACRLTAHRIRRREGVVPSTAYLTIAQILVQILGFGGVLYGLRTAVRIHFTKTLSEYGEKYRSAIFALP
jgi:hypothetical protein